MGDAVSKTRCVEWARICVNDRPPHRRSSMGTAYRGTDAHHRRTRSDALGPGSRLWPGKKLIVCGSMPASVRACATDVMDDPDAPGPSSTTIASSADFSQSQSMLVRLSNGCPVG